ncbi:DNA mismatch repair endonuclease MutL [Oceanimonas baumannii]|uniref:DNA mismatch repair protein MutL n=1 Tax=Oceanimonas baumannii TaxID=129578 RepID=A0A235CEZ1_9GAMM|nr:DNA mismatch repair endonuclease MutL [Oceanimonas baumannii]OYD22939.1 DNA mismatch repair endonuclease MutL [Oceanimonas baumannii]TDW54037.1 DNA mismatch repair protein MutL [Oceanimonas baumannii]
MGIQILPARLANQIAAGEVVERPASVVKELVENSLDAGATRIDVDIEKGGAKLIRIRDNGCGIDKNELTLALSRHATSKVSTLDDLEAIVSLGFRGEALASISSVSRLLLTSRTAEQEEAWQAMAEGRDMAVQLQPASHPQGTTVEVADLFFNTPARRRFLRTEKTEFGHIDEVLRRIALSRFDVSITLRHNGKPVRQYRAGTLPSQHDKRLAAVCGQAFVSPSLKFDSEHHGLRLWGWLAPASAARNQPDVQYTYVNGRMMRDKLFNHAVRQAYGERLPAEGHAAFVLYLELDAHEVDVNVHPAKHEVRFHQARLVHDFIYQVLQQTLEQEESAPAGSAEQTETIGFSGEPDAGYDAQYDSAAVSSAPRYTPAGHGYGKRPERSDSALSQRQWQGVDSLMTTLPKEDNAEPPAVTPAGAPADGAPLLLEQNRVLVVRYRERLWVCELNLASAWLNGRALLAAWQQGLTPQPLLLPVRLSLPAGQKHLITTHEALLQKLGLELKTGPGDTIILTRVPQPLRHADLARLFPELLVRLEQEEARRPDALCHWLTQQAIAREEWNWQRATVLWQQLLPELSEPLPEFMCPVDLQPQLNRWIYGD